MNLERKGCQGFSPLYNNVSVPKHTVLTLVVCQPLIVSQVLRVFISWRKLLEESGRYIILNFIHFNCQLSMMNTKWFVWVQKFLKAEFILLSNCLE